MSDRNQLERLQQEENRLLREQMELVSKPAPKPSKPAPAAVVEDNPKICPVCQGPKRPEAKTCAVCQPMRLGNQTPKAREFEIIKDSLMPFARTSMTRALEALRDGEVGWSFTCVGCSRNAINDATRRLGLQGKVRTFNLTPEEKDPKKRQIQVWRTDGKSIEEVNNIINQRRQKQ